MRILRFSLGILSAVAVLFGLSTTYGADTAWNTASSGSWTNASNWNNGVPNANAGFLTNATAYTVTYTGGGNPFTNIVVNNPSIGNTTTLSVSSGFLSVTGSQSAGGIMIQSNSLLAFVGGTISNASVTSASQDGVIRITSQAPTLLDNFETYTNNQVLATNASNSVAGSPWGRFGTATADNPTAYTGRGVGGSVAMQCGFNWTLGANASVEFFFPSPTNLASLSSISIDLAVSNVSATVSNTFVKVGFEQGDGTVWQTKTNVMALLTNANFQTFVFNLSSADMERSVGAGAFDLSSVLDLRIRVENAGATGTQHVLVDNYQGAPRSLWYQSAGNVNIGDAGNGTMIIGTNCLVTGPANTPRVGRNSVTASASNGVGRLYLAGGTWLWPGRSGSANPMYIGQGEIGIVTISNGCFALTGVQATNGLRIGAVDTTVTPVRGLGTLEMFGGVVTNIGFLQLGIGSGPSTAFGAGTITVSGGTFYQLGFGGDVRLGFTNFDNGYLSVNGSGTFISTNTINIGWAAGSSGSVQVSGNGQLFVTNIPTSRAILLVSGNGGTGTFTLSGGTTTVDWLVATNGASSIVNFNSGVLNVKNRTIMNNGSTFTIGDGLNAATYNLLAGSTHTFSNGLHVSANATLQGIGAIDGQPVSIASGGVLSPGDGVGTLTISNDLSSTGAAVFQYDLGTNSDFTVVSGSVSLNGVLNVNDSGGFTNGTYVLFNYGSFGSLSVSVGSLPAGFSGTVSNDAGNSQIVLNVTLGAPPSDPFSIWQNQYFGSTNCTLCGGGADFDGDGIINTNEFLAGTNPTNSLSGLRMLTTVRTGNDVKVTWSTAGGKTNIVQATSGAANGSYTNNFTDIPASQIILPGSGDITTNYIEVGGATNAPSRYYRVRLVP